MIEHCSGSAINRPGNEIPVYLSDLSGESPYLVRLIMETIHKHNKTKIKHIGSRNFGIQYLLKGIYSHNDLLFFHVRLKNSSTVSFDIDYVVFKIVDFIYDFRFTIYDWADAPAGVSNNLKSSI
jgi:hypothetical protein